MADADLLPASYDQFVKQAEAAEQRLRAEGWIIHRVDLDPDQFLAWCTARNVDADAQARLAWGNAAVASLYRHPR